MDTICRQLQDIRKRIPPQVLLVAVSKNQHSERILEAYRCGQRHFAESRPQEFARKAATLPPDIAWHFIGHLQTNKIKMVLPRAHLIHSVDSVRLLMEIERAACADNCTANCLMQVHIAREEQKFGFAPQEAFDFFAQNQDRTLPHVCLRGLMGIATNTNDMDAVRREFEALARLHEQIKALKPRPDFECLSIGMSGDYPIAIEAGSTLVRIGSAIFGSR